ncbi:MAG TPA: hypothetical protein VF765_28865 [Polyangiaceae bacterium]
MTRRRAAIVSAYAGMLTLLLVLGTRAGFGAYVWLGQSTWEHAHAAHGALAWAFWVALNGMGWALMGPWLTMLLACAAPVAVVAVVARARAWRRVSAGLADPLEDLRRRPWAMRLAAWAPAAAYLALYLRRLFTFTLPSSDPLALAVVHDLLPFVLVALGIGKLGSMVVRELVEPVRDERAPSPPRAEGDVVFSAIAVSSRTRGAIGMMGVASAAMALWVGTAPIATLVESPAFLAAVAAYVAAAAGAAYAFRRASRVTVGIDGVYVGEAASVRFFAYREMDEARAAGADLELVRDGRVVLRLQLHGDDAGRRDEVLARIAAAIARARSGETRGAEALVQSMAARRNVVAAAIEPPGYREASLTREHLWELVEGAATDAPTRTAAAEALVLTLPLDGDERSRLRVAASRVADPRVRVALGSLAREEAEDEAEPGEAEGQSERELSV